MTPEIRRRRLIALAIVLGALVVMAVLLALRPRPQRHRPATVAPLVMVEVMTDERQPITVTGWGTVRPRDTVTLVPQVGGLVIATSPNLRAGGFFAAGEILLEIEAADYELAVSQARSQVAQAQVGLAMAREEAAAARMDWERTSRNALDIERTAGLQSGRARAGEPGQAGVELDGGRPGPLVLREPQLRQAEAQLAAAEAALERAELDLRRCKLIAPFPGRVQGAAVSVGQVVRAAEVLANLYDTEIAEITVNLPDRELAWITLPLTPEERGFGTPATVRAFFAGADHAWPGRAVRLGGSVDEGSRQVPVVVEVADPYERRTDRPPLLSGLFVSVEFTTEPPPGSVTIPRRALRPGDEVWLLDTDNRLSIRRVHVARTDLETAVISAGLAPGDRLITSSLQYVVDGMRLAPMTVDDADAAADTVEGAAPAADRGAETGVVDPEGQRP